MAAGCDEVGLSDTTGYADPAAVRRLIKLVRGVVGEAALTGIHLHNTRGLGLANALAALDCGLTTLDASQGGLGGCPFAPGAIRQHRHRGPWSSCWRPWVCAPAST